MRCCQLQVVRITWAHGCYCVGLASPPVLWPKKCTIACTCQIAPPKAPVATARLFARRQLGASGARSLDGLVQQPRASASALHDQEGPCWRRHPTWDICHRKRLPSIHKKVSTQVGVSANRSIHTVHWLTQPNLACRNPKTLGTTEQVTHHTIWCWEKIILSANHRITSLEQSIPLLHKGCAMFTMGIGRMTSAPKIPCVQASQKKNKVPVFQA